MTELAGVIDDRMRGTVKTVLRAKERIADPHLCPDAQAELRQIIVDEINALGRLAKTLIAALDGQLSDGFAMNQLWLETIGSELGVTPPEP